MKKIFIGSFFILFFLQGFSKHIVGGELYYDCLGDNKYLITLKLYRDCYGGGAPYDNPAFIGVFDSSGVSVMDLEVPFPGSKLVANSINNPCIIPPTDICLEAAFYTMVVTLPPIPGGYDLAYQRCCRNATISNIVNPGGNNVGVTYTCHIPDTSVVACNSSPRFNLFPPVFLCANEHLNFDHSAKDPDGDSLVYEFANPFEGGIAASVPPSPPPYSEVPWLPPYNIHYQMSALPVLALDSVTGLLTGTPNSIGQWVVGIRVKEYRNKKLISVNMRDFQFNVVACNYIQVSSIPSQTTFCFGMTAHFLNASLNATTYHWDFGDPFSTKDTSSLITPDYTYSQPGTYKVMLVVNPGWLCADTSYTTFVINPLLSPSFVPGAPQCLTGNNFQFAAGGAFQGNGTFMWNFGANATPKTSTLQNVSNVTFNAPGTYPVTLTVSENGCAMTFRRTVKVLPEPAFAYSPPPVTGCAPFTVQFSDSSFKDTSVTQVLWNFGDGTSSSQNSPNHTYSLPGIYTVSVAITSSNFCVENVSFVVPNMVTVNPSPKAGLHASPTTITVVDPTVAFTDISHGSSNCWIYFGDGDSSNNCDVAHTYDVNGTYMVYQVVENKYGCKDYDTLKIVSDIFAFWIPNAFTPNADNKNEVFGPVTLGVEKFHFVIFDRWGKLIFESYNPATGWDGTRKGTLCQEDVYVWKIDLEKEGDHNTKRNYIGHVNLIR